MNYGKYSAQVVNNTPPAWTARNGEFVFFASGAIKRVYFYNINAWDYLEYNGGGTTGSLKSVQTFTANGTWTRPSGIAGVVVEVVAGGGGGGGATAAGGGGGGGGGYSKLLTGSPGTAQTVTIGAGGAGGAVGGAGNAGGTTSFGSLVSASGGGGGEAGTASNPGAAGGAGGVGASGTINLAGESGHRGSTTISNSSSFETGGGGGSGNGMGPGAAAWLAVAQNQAGNSGTLYGGGGGGGVRSTIDQVGGAGAAGICIVWEYS